MKAYHENNTDSRKICFIVGAGDNYGINPVSGGGHIIIAADGGLSYLRQQGLAPDFVVGDFDSFEGEIPEGAKILPSKKDITDVWAAVELGMEKGFGTFVIYGGTGGRPDHTFANIQMLSYIACTGMQGFIIDEKNIFTVIRNDIITFGSSSAGFMSVFSLSDVSKGVTEKGLKYTLENAELTNTFPLGVSNEFIGKDASVRVDDGILLVIYPRFV